MACSMNKWKGKVAIVTGASAGIGAAIVETLVGHGLKVVGLARRKEVIEELANKLQDKEGELYALKADLTKESDILDAIQWVKDNLGSIDILINNAGLFKYNTLLKGETQEWKQTFDTNVLGLCIATREVANYMVEHEIAGHIIHINSIVGHKVINYPNMNVYPASKFAVTALTETLRNELVTLGSKIKITSISPGGVETEFLVATGKISEEDSKNMYSSIPTLKAQDIADAVAYVLSTPPHVQVHELTIKPVGEMY